VRLASDMPEADRPHIQVLDSRGAFFHQMLTKAVADAGTRFSACDFDIPVREIPKK